MTTQKDKPDDKINIQCSEDENGDYNINVDISNFLQEFEKISQRRPKPSNQVMDHSELYAEISNYDMNFSVKQLTLICEYYGIKPTWKINKSKKNDLIEIIMIYENNSENIMNILKRKQLWYYMDEVKGDKFLKKFIISW